MVHWQSTRIAPDESLWQLCCLNDRFALDGLSPPSYGGLLWCFGWQDKPAHGNRVSEKWAHKYRTGASGFLLAKERVLAVPLEVEEPFDSTGSGTKRTKAALGKGEDGDNGSSDGGGKPTFPPTAKKARKDDTNAAKKRTDPKTISILSFFGPSATTAHRTIG